MNNNIPDLQNGAREENVAAQVPVEPQQPPLSTLPGPKPKHTTKWGIALGVLLLFTAVASVVLLVEPSPTPPTKVYKIGILDALPGYFGGSVAGFKQKMVQLGYIQGKNITYEIKDTSTVTGNQAILRTFVQHKDDLIIAIPTEAAIEAEMVTKNTRVPVVTIAASIEGSSIIDNVQHPGHNITGVRFPGPEDSVKRLDVLHQLDPTATRILVPYLAGYPNVPGQLAAVQAEAKTLGLTLLIEPLTPTGVATYVASLPATKPGFKAILGMAEPFNVTPALNAPLYTFADQHGIPIVAGSVNSDNTGPIASIAPSSTELGVLAAPLAQKIFHGEPAGTLPIITPQSYLQVNLKAIGRLGLPTPDSGLLSTATKIVR